jgi:CubicO group peptidase (beta-lactamase class C family)
MANRGRVPLSLHTEFAEWPDDDDGVLARVAATLAAAEPIAPVWSYANAGWCLLGRAVEVATGLVWEEAMRAYALEPFGLTGTTYTTWRGGEPQVRGHEHTSGGAMPADPWVPRNLGPAGSTVLATAPDVLRLAAHHLVDPALAPLRETHADIAISAWFDGWGLGWARFDWPGGQVWGWDGLTSGQRASLRLIPDRDAAIVLLTNSSAGRSMYRSLFAAILPGLFGVTVPPLRLTPTTSHDLSRYTGVYAWPDRLWRVTAAATALVIDQGDDTIEALPIDDRTFLVDPADADTPTITFGAFDSAGRPGAVYDMLWALPRVD